MLDFVNQDALGGSRSRPCASPHARHEGCPEAQFGRLAKACVALAHRADFAAQSDLAEYHHVGRHRLVGQRGNDGGSDGQVFALIVMGIAAAEVVVGLGLVVAMTRREMVLDTDELRSLNG